MNYKVIDYYLALLPICYKQQGLLPIIPDHIARFIFSFVGTKQIMDHLNNQKLYDLYKRQISRELNIAKSYFYGIGLKQEHFKNIQCFHPFDNIPYPNSITIQEIVTKFLLFSKINNHGLKYSHLCCENKGCVFNIQMGC